MNRRVVAVTDPVTTDSTFRNVRGQPDSVVTRVAGHRYARVNTYTGLGLLDSVVVTNDAGVAFRRRVYTYDAALLTLSGIRLNQPAAALAGLTAIARNNDILPVTTTYRGGDQVTQQYSTRNSLAQISSGALYGPTIGKSVQYDAAGRLQVQVNGDQVTARQFTYDGLGRLRSDTALVAQSPPPECGQGQIIGDNGVNCIPYYTWQAQGGVAFSYDSVGNRRDQGGLYGTGNRITSFAGCGYTTDADGNVTGRTNCGGLTATFKWTAESRLDTVIVGGQTVGYHYDAAGRLVRKDVNGSAQSHFLWDGDNLLAELNGAGTGLVAEYSYYAGLDNPHAIVTNGVEYDYHQDVVGNVVAVTDSAQNVVREYGYDPWGNLTGGMDNLPFSGADRVRWKGALWLGNEANLYYMRARWYEPASGRFLSEDPVGLAAGLNAYVFGHADPVNISDPMGTQPCPPGLKPVGIEHWTIEVNGRTVDLGVFVKCEGGGKTQMIPVGDYEGPLPVGGGTHTIDWGDQDGILGRVRACAVSHFHLDELKGALSNIWNDVKAVSYLAATPVPKVLIGEFRMAGSSIFTNPISASRLLFGDIHLETRILGTNSLFGVAGRANAFLAAGMFAYDATSLSLCIFTNDPDYGP